MGILKFLWGLITGKKGGVELIDPLEGYRNEEQEKAKFYFDEKNKKGCFSSLKGCFAKKPAVVVPKKKGCFPKKKAFVSDAEYDALVNAIVAKLDPQNKGLAKLNVDSSQVEKTIHFENYTYEGISDGKWGDDGKFRSTEYIVTYIYFTRTQMLVYQVTLSTDWNRIEEVTNEYFYKDITNFYSQTITQDIVNKTNGNITNRIDKNLFTIIVPGDKFIVTLPRTKEQEENVQALKAMLREKKA